MAVTVPRITFQVENFQLIPMIGEEVFAQVVQAVSGEAQLLQREMLHIVLAVEGVFADHEQMRIVRDYQPP